MPLTVSAAALWGVLLAGASSPAPAAESPPRVAVGPVFAIAHIAGGSGEHDEALSVGLLAVYRPLRFVSVSARWSRTGVDHDYRQLSFNSAYHRFYLALEGRLPLGNRFDFLGYLGPELVVLRSAYASGASGPRRASGVTAGPSFGGGVDYRLGRLGLRAEVGFGHRDRRWDRAFAAAVTWSWR